MLAIRSIAFAVVFYGWTTLLSPLYIPLMVLPRRGFWFMAWLWVRSCIAIVRGVAGIDCEVRGEENLTGGAVIIASKHQSAWDTLIYNKLFEDCAYVLKRELFMFPCFGWFLWKVGMIGVDRQGGAGALKELVRQTRDCLAAGRTIIIFPQGTRTPPGEERPYLPGVAALYRQCDVPVVPVALNSGLYWPRRRFIKRQGKIILEYLEPIQPGLGKRQFLDTLRARLEEANRRIEAEGRAQLESR